MKSEFLRVSGSLEEDMALHTNIITSQNKLIELHHKIKSNINYHQRTIHDINTRIIENDINRRVLFTRLAQQLRAQHPFLLRLIVDFCLIGYYTSQHALVAVITKFKEIRSSSFNCLSAINVAMVPVRDVTDEQLLHLDTIPIH